MKRAIGLMIGLGVVVGLACVLFRDLPSTNARTDSDSASPAIRGNDLDGKPEITQPYLRRETPQRDLVVRILRARQGDTVVAIERAKWMPWTEEDERDLRTKRNVPVSRLDRNAIELKPEQDGSIRLPAEGGDGLVAIAARGFAPTGRLIRAGEGDVEIAVASGPSFHAKVVDNQKQPIADARVMVRYDLFNAHPPDDPTPLDVRAARAMFEREATTDANGIAVVEQRALGPFIATASKPGMGSAVYALGDEETIAGAEFEFVLGMSAVLTGRVVDDETSVPLEDVRLEASVFQHRDYWAGTGIAYTNERGEFRMDGVAAEAELQFVVAMLEGYAGDSAPLGGLSRGEVKHVDIRMKRSVSFVGYVRDPQGKPLNEVRLNIAEPDRRPGGLEEARTGPDGRFEFTAVAKDRPWMIVPQKKGYQLRWISIPSPWKQPFEIELQPLLPLHGRVIGEGYPLSNAKVRIVQEERYSDRYFEQWADIDPATGEFTFLEVPGGTFHFDVLAEGYAPKRRVSMPIPSTEPRENVEIALERGFTIEGRVVDARSSEPLAEATVFWGDTRADSDVIAGALEIAATTNAEGRFTIATAPIGRRVVLIVRRDGFATQVLDFESERTKAAVTREVQMQPEGVIEISVRLADGTHAPRIYGSVNGPDHIERTVTTTEGKLVFRRLVGGPHAVQVILDRGWGEFDGYTQGRDGVQVTAGETTKLEWNFSGGATLRLRVHGAGFAAFPERFYVVALKLDAPDERCRVADFTNYGSGTTTLLGLSPGEYDVYATTLSGVVNYRVAKLVKVVGNETIDIDFEVTDRILTAIVANVDGAPIESARIGVRSRGIAGAATAQEGAADRWRNGRSDGDGRAWICGFLPGSLEYIIECDGYARSDGVIEVDPAAGHESLEHRFSLEKECLLAVAVWDREHSRIEGASLHVESPGRRRLDSSGREQTRFEPDGSNTDGRSLFHGLGTGEFTVHADAAGFFGQDVKVKCTAGATLDVDLALRWLAPYSVHLRSSDGAPLREVEVELTDLETQESVAEWIRDGRLASGTRTTDRDGTLRFAALPLGRYRLEAPGISEEIEVRAGFDEDEIATLRARK